MKILLFTLEYPPFKGGIANYYGNLVRHCPKDNEIFVLHNNENKLLSNKIYPKWIPAFFALYKSIKKNKINHVIVGHILPLGTVTFLLSKIFNFKYSIVLHGMDLEYALKRKQKKYLAKLILKHAQTIISTNSYVEKKMLNFLGSKFDHKSFVVNPGVSSRNVESFGSVPSKTASKQDGRGTWNAGEFSNFRKKHDLEGKFILFTVGRLVRRKGQDRVIEAVQNLREIIPNLYYYIAGAGEDEMYLKNLAKNNSHVNFLGAIDDAEKDLWLKNCDIFIMPSRDINGDVEGFGIVYLEAALAGKPVIAGRSGGVSDAVVDYETGILVEPDNVDSIEDAIQELYRNFDLRQELGDNAMKRAISSFSWKGQAGKFFEICGN